MRQTIKKQDELVKDEFSKLLKNTAAQELERKKAIEEVKKLREEI